MIKFIIKLFCVNDYGTKQKRTYWVEADDENMALIKLGADIDQDIEVTGVYSVEAWLDGSLLYVEELD